ncbi:MAG: hemerythrin family protein [Phenylobacterium sp.]|nr:hemerythrin family protein [Phenylobacterium sp.]
MSFMQAKPAATFDFYGPIHKGLRLAHAQLLVRLGCADVDSHQAVAELVADVRTQCHLAEHHLANEDLWVHTALEARAPGASARLAQSHDHHRHAIEEIEELCARAEGADAPERPALMRQLYLRYSLFVAEDFAHMAEEEQLILPVLQSLFTDQELASIEDHILSGLTPEELITFGRLMIPAATPRDRVAFLGAIRANAPAEAFGAIMEMAAKASLAPGDYARLCDGLRLAA